MKRSGTATSSTHSLYSAANLFFKCKIGFEMPTIGVGQIQENILIKVFLAAYIIEMTRKISQNLETCISISRWSLLYISIFQWVKVQDFGKWRRSLQCVILKCPNRTTIRQSWKKSNIFGVSDQFVFWSYSHITVLDAYGGVLANL